MPKHGPFEKRLKMAYRPPGGKSDEKRINKGFQGPLEVDAGTGCQVRGAYAVLDLTPQNSTETKGRNPDGATGFFCPLK